MKDDTVIVSVSTVNGAYFSNRTRTEKSGARANISSLERASTTLRWMEKVTSMHPL